MKVVIDPLYTTKLENCSNFLRARNLVEYLLAKREDIFIYFLLPCTGKESEHNDMFEFDEGILLEDERIAYYQIPTYVDPVKNFLYLRPEFVKMFSANGELWDWDVMITYRSPLGGQIRNISSLPQSKPYARRALVLTEEWALLRSNSKTPIPSHGMENLVTIQGMSCFDHMLTLSESNRICVLNEARKVLSPSSYMEFKQRLKYVSSVKLGAPEFREASHIEEVVNRTKQFVVGHIQQGAKIKSVDDTFSIVRKHWERHGAEGNMKLLNLAADGVAVPAEEEFLETIRCDAGKYTEYLVNDIDVLIATDTTVTGDQVLEAILCGVPVICKRTNQVDHILGDDYPLYITDGKDAYGLITEFYSDYSGMYSLWKAWVVGSFLKKIKDLSDKGYNAHVYRFLCEFEDEMRQVARNHRGAMNKSIVKIRNSYIDEGFDLDEILVDLQKAKQIPKMDSFIPPLFKSKGLKFIPCKQTFRRGLVSYFEYLDNDTIPGSLVFGGEDV